MSNEHAGSPCSHVAMLIPIVLVSFFWGGEAVENTLLLFITLMCTKDCQQLEKRSEESLWDMLKCSARSGTVAVSLHHSSLSSFKCLSLCCIGAS